MRVCACQPRRCAQAGASAELLADGEWVTDEMVTSDPDFSDGRPNVAIGDVDLLTPEVLEHVAAPLDMSTTEPDSSDDESYTKEGAAGCGGRVRGGCGCGLTPGPRLSHAQTRGSRPRSGT